MKLKAVVLGWEGKEERARAVAMHLRGHVDSVRLTYSTMGSDIAIPGVEGARVPTESFFGGKFAHSIRDWSDEAMLLVHADTVATDWVALCYTYANNGIAVRDRSVSVRHDPGSGYPPQHAARQMDAFLQQMTLPEQVQYQFLQLAIQTRRQAWLNSRHG